MSAEDLQVYADKVSKLFTGEDFKALPGKISEAVGELLRQSDMVEDEPKTNADTEADQSTLPSMVGAEAPEVETTTTTVEPISDIRDDDAAVAEKPWRKTVLPGKEASELPRESSAVEWVLESAEEPRGSAGAARGVELTDQERRILRSRIQQLKYNYDMLINH